MKLLELVWRDKNVFFDMWSFVHLLWGIIFGYVLVHFFDFSLLISFLLAFFAMVLWESFEFAVGIKETWLNISSDLIIGPIGFLFGYMVLIEAPYHFQIFSGILFVVCILASIGWYKSLIRKMI